jgi:hypothetical protein
MMDLISHPTNSFKEILDFAKNNPNLQTELGNVSDFVKTLENAAKNTYNNLKAKTNQNLETIQNQLMSSLNSSPLKDPLIIDLNGDGIRLSSWQDSGVNFDLDSNGFKEKVGWVLGDITIASTITDSDTNNTDNSTVAESASTTTSSVVAESTLITNDDVFLAIDKNNNNIIDDITELFGNNTISGFSELSKYDSNADRIIDSKDNQFNLLKLWNDYNSNGITDNGELTTISNSAISSISLNAYQTNYNINNSGYGY